MTYRFTIFYVELYYQNFEIQDKALELGFVVSDFSPDKIPKVFATCVWRRKNRSDQLSKMNLLKTQKVFSFCRKFLRDPVVGVDRLSLCVESRGQPKFRLFFFRQMH